MISTKCKGSKLDLHFADTFSVVMRDSDTGLASDIKSLEVKKTSQDKHAAVSMGIRTAG